MPFSYAVIGMRFWDLRGFLGGLLGMWGRWGHRWLLWERGQLGFEFKNGSLRCKGIRVYKMGASRLGLLGRDRGQRLLGVVGGNSPTRGGGTESGVVGKGLQLILSMVREFAGENRGPSSLFRINMVKLVGTVSGFGPALSMEFDACKIPVVVNRVEQFLHSGGSIEISHSVESATCHTVRVGRRLAGGGGHRPAIRRVTGVVRVPGRRIILTLRTVIRPISLCRPIFSSKGSAVCMVSRVNSGGSSSA